MKKKIDIVIDVNIFMDFLFKREGHEKVVKIFEYCSKDEIKGFVCAHEITTLYYFLNKTIKDKRKIKISISGIIKSFNVIELNEDLLEKALTSAIDDFEDAVIDVSAETKNAAYILTRNTRDFRKSVVKAITPEELLAIVSI